MSTNSEKFKKHYVRNKTISVLEAEQQWYEHYKDQKAYDKADIDHKEIVERNMRQQLFIFLAKLDLRSINEDLFESLWGYDYY